MIKLRQEGIGTIKYATTLSAGFDICSSCNWILAPGEIKAIPTGLYIEECNIKGNIKGNSDFIPELQIRSKSGLAVNKGVVVLNSPGTIDADYRGEIKVILINHSKEDFHIGVGDKIAQGVCALIKQIPGIEVVTKERGVGGFGSTEEIQLTQEEIEIAMSGMTIYQELIPYEGSGE